MASSLSHRMSMPRPDALPPALPELPPPLSMQIASDEALDPTLASSPFLIRTVRLADLVALSEVLASSFHSPDGWMRWLYPLLRTGIYEDLRSRMHSRGEHYVCLVAVSPGRKEPIVQSPALSLLSGSDTIVGSVEMNLKTPSLLQPWNQKYLYLSNLAVQADYRRQGVAQMLLQLCDRIALDWGFSDLYLHVLESNHAARRLYWKSGYRARRIETNPLSLMLGQSRQLLLHKRLK
ncbi:MAG: GNAT family N-acetyltransferase [Pegethrix bostrychoides GSE-TBD4-15B]|uniref:GNAT family N-acetyltransferase n=1 Tax=Pegethrix bostrychoides GSE-TBD4-15B TaxID=2839662 RepID=A0A951PDJ4_9CYAN|nr:GNAT family N-acetyltransferase [Pegethrix bostrychoides GSE-TBD4-15B]